jgi:hypothetical protein
MIMPNDRVGRLRYVFDWSGRSLGIRRRLAVTFYIRAEIGLHNSKPHILYPHNSTQDSMMAFRTST